jgi:hypothetical protein
MMKMVDISTVSIVVASAGVFAAAIYYILQIRHQTKLRQTEMVMRLYATFGSAEFQNAYQKIMGLEFEDYADALKRYATNRAEISSAATSVGTFFEGIGVLAKRRLISIDLVDDLFGTMILHTWEKFKPLVKGRREQEETTETLQWFEYLYNEMLKRKQQQAKIG